MFHCRNVSWLIFWAAQVQNFLDIALAERKSMVQPEGVPDDAQREGGGGRVCGQARKISLMRLTCQNPVPRASAIRS